MGKDEGNGDQNDMAFGLEERGLFQANSLLLMKPKIPSKGSRVSKAPRWTPWRELLKRSFGVDGWACPHCGQRMRLRAVVLPPATLKILRGLQAACRAPPGAEVLRAEASLPVGATPAVGIKARKEPREPSRAPPP